MNSATVTRMLQSRGMTCVTAAVCCLACWLAFRSGNVVEMQGSNGLVLPSPNRWIADPALSMLVNMGLVLLTAALMMTLNGIFNFIRSISTVYAGIFLLMQMAVPDLVVQLYGGTVLAVTLMLCTLMLFSCYTDAGGNRRIFLIFFLLSLGSLSLYCFVPFIAVFLLGMAQMRIFNPRTLLAALIGLITPVWLLAGFSLIDLRTVSSPHLVSIFTNIDLGETLHLVIIVAATAAVGIGSWVMNFTKMIAYNAKNRAFTGFISLLTFASLAMMLLDYSNLTAYLPVFNVCAAFQAGHLIVSRQKQRGYIFIGCLWALYLTFYLWRMLV